MKKLLYTILFTTIVASATAAPVRKDRWHSLMKLVTNEMKILESAKKKSPELYYRMLELHSERLKLLHEKNNKTFMALSKKANSFKDKEKIFAETRNYYKFTRDFGVRILKEYPLANRRAEVLFALALNSRDYGKDNITEGYLLESISLVKDPHSSLRHHAETALADYYYNEKRYPEAVTYYERAIKKREDEWLTKHYFNLSWCYLKAREFDKAIKAIRTSYSLSKNKAYVDISDQVLNNIGSFYVYAGRPLEGLAFYLKYEKNPIPFLLPMAAKTSEKGHEKETEAILGASQDLVYKRNLISHQEEIYHSFLDFYRQYSRYADHEATSRKMVVYYQKAAKSKKLKKDMREDAIEKMRSTAGFLQLKLAKNMKEDGGTYKAQELSIVLNYFKHLIALDTKRKVEYYYFRGETYYSVRRFVDAAPAYIDCVNQAKKAKNDEFARKSLNSLLALTGMEVLEKNLNKKYLIYAYSEHITLWPRDEKSEQIYPKLFAIYHLDGIDTKAATVIRTYNKAYPQHLKEQQVLMTKILDLFIERKDTKKLAAWIHEFKKGFLKFPTAMIEKTEMTLGNLLFMEYQDLAKKGQKLAAAKGFESIFKNKLYTNKVKAQAAFFAALTHLELADTAKSYQWQALAYTKMSDEEKLAKRDEQLKMTERTYKLQDFQTSYKISEFLLKKFCHLKDKTQNRLFEIAIMTSLVEENTSSAETAIKQYSKCTKKSESKEIALSQIYSHFEKKGDFQALRLFVNRYPTELFKNQYRFTLQKWFWERTNFNLKEQIRKEFKVLNHPETLAWLREMEDFKVAEKTLEELKNDVIWDKPKFDGDAYNKALEAHLLKVQSFKQNYQHLTSSTQVDLAILSTRLFSSMYLTLGEKISTIKPKGMDPKIYVPFNTAMKQVGGQFLDVSRQFDTQLDKALKEKETLAWGQRSIASVEQIENPVFSFFTGLTMDKSREE